MNVQGQPESATTDGARGRLGLRMSLACGEFSIPLERIFHLAGYVTLTGEADETFRGWMEFRGLSVPVFDVGLVMCDRATEERFGSRIVVIEREAGARTRYVGLLAGGVSDTVSSEQTGGVEAFDLDGCLPLLASMIPTVPAGGRGA